MRGLIKCKIKSLTSSFRRQLAAERVLAAFLLMASNWQSYSSALAGPSDAVPISLVLTMFSVTILTLNALFAVLHGPLYTQYCTAINAMVTFWQAINQLVLIAISPSARRPWLSAQMVLTVVSHIIVNHDSWPSFGLQLATIAATAIFTDIWQCMHAALSHGELVDPAAQLRCMQHFGLVASMYCIVVLVAVVARWGLITPKTEESFQLCELEVIGDAVDVRPVNAVSIPHSEHEQHSAHLSLNTGEKLDTKASFKEDAGSQRTLNRHEASSQEASSRDTSAHMADKPPRSEGPHARLRKRVTGNGALNERPARGVIARDPSVLSGAWHGYSEEASLQLMQVENIHSTRDLLSPSTGGSQTTVPGEPDPNRSSMTLLSTADLSHALSHSRTPSGHFKPNYNPSLLSSSSSQRIPFLEILASNPQLLNPSSERTASPPTSSSIPLQPAPVILVSSNPDITIPASMKHYNKRVASFRQTFRGSKFQPIPEGQELEQEQVRRGRKPHKRSSCPAYIASANGTIQISI